MTAASPKQTPATQSPKGSDGKEQSARPRSRMRRRLLILLAVLLALPLAALLALGLWPAPKDYMGDEGTAGVGAGGGGLRRPFPRMIVAADNGVTHEKYGERAALGRLLYFDPVLSGANDISCATCHHPDLGLADGRRLSMGKGAAGIGPERAGGAVVRRGAPTIWNAAFNHKQFWDGRAETLEEQAKGPITSEIEMAENPETLVKELRAIPEYTRRFDAAFGGESGSSITLDNVTKAIAAFERHLTANNSPFDRYVNGDLSALTPAQRRGFNLFRSGKTRCFECHGLPTFANPDFKIVGVPDLEGQPEDFGRFEVTNGEGNKRAFKVPTLRNVVLNAPYMHNGRFQTLEEVIDFYAAGGGPGIGFATPHIDDKMRPYTITPEEKADLVAFLHALTDESNLPEFPDRVPSGMPVVPRLINPARTLVARYNTGVPISELTERAPQVITVKPGESIQAAVDSARHGDTIEVLPGVYHEEVTVDLNNITLLGLSQTVPGDGPARPVLDGKRTLSDAVIATGDNFHIENFEVRHYTSNGVVVQNAHGPVFRNLLIDDTGLYGTYPVSCTGVTIERVTATRIADAAIYVGQSRDIVVRDSVAHGSVTGIEIENSVNAVVENNHVYNNTGGILVFVLPNNPSKVGRNCRVVNNRVIENNHPNFGNPNAIVSKVPPGGGILIMAADDTEVTGNEIRGNNSYGVAVMSLEGVFPKGTSFDVGPTPENNRIHGNTYSNNGSQPAESIKRAGLGGADLLWDLTGWSNTWHESTATASTPTMSAGWPSVARLAYWRALQLVMRFQS